MAQQHHSSHSDVLRRLLLQAELPASPPAGAGARLGRVSASSGGSGGPAGDAKLARQVARLKDKNRRAQKRYREKQKVGALVSCLATPMLGLHCHGLGWMMTTGIEGFGFNGIPGAASTQAKAQSTESRIEELTRQLEEVQVQNSALTGRNNVLEMYCKMHQEEQKTAALPAPAGPAAGGGEAKAAMGGGYCKREAWWMDDATKAAMEREVNLEVFISIFVCKILT